MHVWSFRSRRVRRCDVGVNDLGSHPRKRSLHFSRRQPTVENSPERAVSKEKATPKGGSGRGEDKLGTGQSWLSDHPATLPGEGISHVRSDKGFVARGRISRLAPRRDRG